MRLVLLNDDGPKGLDILRQIAKMLEPEHTVVGAVIPKGDRSCTGGYLRVGMHVPVAIQEGEFPIYVIDGFPAEAVYFAKFQFEENFDAFVSVNVGNNLGTDIFNSATVMSIVQGYWIGFSGVAFSIHPNLLRTRKLPRETLHKALSRVERVSGAFSVNFPAQVSMPIPVASTLGRVTRLSDLGFDNRVFHVSDLSTGYSDAVGEDTYAISRGLVPITDLVPIFGSVEKRIVRWEECT